jgi:F0F1-type ATP synthase assembly protein I
MKIALGFIAGLLVGAAAMIGAVLYDDRIVSESEKLTGKARGLFDDDDPAAELPQGL